MSHSFLTKFAVVTDCIKEVPVTHRGKGEVELGSCGSWNIPLQIRSPNDAATWRFVFRIHLIHSPGNAAFIVSLVHQVSLRLWLVDATNTEVKHCSLTHAAH